MHFGIESWSILDLVESSVGLPHVGVDDSGVEKVHAYPADVGTAPEKWSALKERKLEECIPAFHVVAAFGLLDESTYVIMRTTSESARP
jgi:hypothetical protein